MEKKESSSMVGVLDTTKLTEKDKAQLRRAYEELGCVIAGAHSSDDKIFTRQEADMIVQITLVYLFGTRLFDDLDAKNIGDNE